MLRTKKSRWLAAIASTFLILLVYVIYLDVTVRQRFEGRIWSLPAKVYARPLDLYVGKSLKTDELVYELERLSYTQSQRIPENTGEYHRWYGNFEIRVRPFRYWDGEEKEKNIRVDIEDGVVVRLHDLYNLKPLDIVRLDPVYIAGIFPAHGEDRELLKLSEVPVIVRDSLIAVEDKRFYEHLGIDPRSIFRAFVANIKAGKTIQGGSTITQQVVKNIFLSPDRSLWRKLNEAIMAVLLEFHYDKDKILETYINEVYFGQDQKRAIHGFGLASRYYFDKSLNDLNLDEISTLVAMVKGASYYNPQKHPARVQKRREVVLKLMLNGELITKRQYDLHVNKPVQVKRHHKRKYHPAFLDLVRRQLKDSYSADDLRSEGLSIFTTMDPYVQEQTEQSVIKRLYQLDAKDNFLQTAAIVASPVDGDVLALVGDRQPSFAGFNRALDAVRPIGSLIKPVIYLAALRKSEKYTLATMLDDTRLRLQGRDKQIWEPSNYDNKYHGNVILFDAFLKSYNIPAVRVGLDVGLAGITNTLNELGLEKEVPPYPSITLGSLELSPFEVATVYQTFATNGFHSPLRSVIAVQDVQGKLLKGYQLSVKKELKAESLNLLNYALMNITRSGTAKRLASEMDIAVAGKTGTSNDLRDSWFAGFSADKIAVVWIGADSNKSTGLTGSSGAMRVWSDVMQKVANQSYELPSNPHIKNVWVDRSNGLISTEECEFAIQLPFIEQSEPKEESTCR